MTSVSVWYSTRDAVAKLADSVLADMRTNPRVRLGLAAIALVLVFALFLRGAQHARERQAELAALRVNEHALAALATPAQARLWTDADAEASQLLERARARLWSDGPTGAAHADFLAWIDGAAKAAGLDGAQVRLGEVRRRGVKGGVTELRVSISLISPAAPIDQAKVYDFLRRIAEERRLIHTRALRVRFVAPAALEADFACYVLGGA